MGCVAAAVEGGPNGLVQRGADRLKSRSPREPPKMFKSLSDRRVSQAALLPLLPILMLPILMLSGVLAGCAPGSWPQLSSVERPAGAADPAPLAAAGEDELTAVAADSAAPPSGQALE